MLIKDAIDLFNDGKDVKIKGWNFKTNTEEYNSISFGNLTRKNTKILKITDTGTGKSIKATPDHKIWTENRGWVEAKHLRKDDKLKIL